jgi:hypothetical protein
MPARTTLTVSGAGRDRLERVLRIPRAFADGAGILPGDKVTAWFGEVLVIVPRGVDASPLIKAMHEGGH